MSFDHWLAFIAASTILVLIPGPTVAVVISYALGMGRRSALATVVGVALGDLTAMTASMIGLGAVLSASAALFNIVKIAGALYLVYLGVKLWRAPTLPVLDTTLVSERSRWRILLHAYVVTALNPKAMVFFVAFVPQFLISSEALLPQIVGLEITFVTIAAANAALYAMIAARARQAVQKPALQRIVNRAGGSLLMGAGVFTALVQKS